MERTMTYTKVYNPTQPGYVYRYVQRDNWDFGTIYNSLTVPMS